jgi:hypothetical protein
LWLPSSRTRIEAPLQTSVAWWRDIPGSSTKMLWVGMQIQPELGWSFSWGPPGFFLAVGVGLQSEVTLTEESHSRWAWNGLGAMINYYLPLVNVTVGFDL